MTEWIMPMTPNFITNTIVGVWMWLHLSWIDWRYSKQKEDKGHTLSTKMVMKYESWQTSNNNILDIVVRIHLHANTLIFLLDGVSFTSKDINKVFMLCHLNMFSILLCIYCI